VTPSCAPDGLDRDSMPCCVGAKWKKKTHRRCELMKQQRKVTFTNAHRPPANSTPFFSPAILRAGWSCENTFFFSFFMVSSGERGWAGASTEPLE
jgi:hypothetical protein